MAAPDPQPPPSPPELQHPFGQAGSGYFRYFGLAVDEPRAVGEDGITDAQRMTRARDVLRNRQFLDRMFNSATKSNFYERTGRITSLPLVSIVDQPGAIWRPTLENVKEWREFADFISKKVEPRIRNEKSAGKVKEIINRAIRRELKYPTTDAARKLHDALKKQTGISPRDLFRPVTRAKVPWGTAITRQTLANAGVFIAGLIVASAEASAAERADEQAQNDPRAQQMDIEAQRFMTDHRDKGALLIQVFELRKMNEWDAADTIYRYTVVSYGASEHEALWREMDRAQISIKTDVFSTEFRRYYWRPPLNEHQDTIIVSDPD